MSIRSGSRFHHPWQSHAQSLLQSRTPDGALSLGAKSGGSIAQSDQPGAVTRSDDHRSPGPICYPLALLKQGRPVANTGGH